MSNAAKPAAAMLNRPAARLAAPLAGAAGAAAGAATSRLAGAAVALAAGTSAGSCPGAAAVAFLLSAAVSKKGSTRQQGQQTSPAPSMQFPKSMVLCTYFVLSGYMLQAYYCT